MPTADSRQPTAPRSRVAFDENPISINTALALWAGLVAGLIIALGGFDDPRPLHNAWVRLMTLGATAVALGWALQAPRVAIARRLQFGVAASLVLHTLLVAGLSQVSLALAVDSAAEANPEPVVAEDTEKLPERVVVEQQPPDERPDFDRPVATAAPQQRTADTAIERSAPQVVETVTRPIEPERSSPVAAALPTERPRPQAAPTRAAELSGPRSRSLAEAVPAEIDPPTMTVPPETPKAESPRAELNVARSTAMPVAAPTISLPSFDLLSNKPPQQMPRRRDDLPVLTAESNRRREVDAPTLAAAPLPVATDAAETSPAPPSTVAPRLARPVPPRLALDRSRAGFGGLVRSLNAALDQRAEAAFPSAARAGAASRAVASQTESGIARTPRSEPESPRSRASAESPRSTLPPNTTAEAEVTAARLPSESSATSSADDRTEFADASRDDLTASAGQQDVDRGEPRIVPERGVGRGAAGGRPELSLAPSRRFPRAAVAPLAAVPLAPTPLTTPAIGRTPSGSAGSAPSPPSPPTGGEPRRANGRRGLTLATPRSTQIASAPSATETVPLRFAMRGDRPLPQLTESTSGRDVSVDAAPGVGGLASIDARSLGLPEEPPRERDAVRETPGAATRARAGGGASIRGEQRRPAAAFDNRGRRQEQLLSGGQGQPAPKTEAAIERGVAFLARQQQDDGRWSFAAAGEPDEAPNVRADGAATGLALLAILGAGYDHFGGPYQRTAERGLDYLTSIQKPSGELFPEDNGSPGADDPNGAWQVARFYSHGIAAIALCEAYGMTGDARLREPAQRALDYIVETQVARYGGWRYTPGVNSDLSVTGWQMMALKSGELAGLRVDRRAYGGVARFLEACRERSGLRARFCYNPSAPASDPRTRHGRLPGTVMTSVGLLVQLYLGESPTSARARAGADHLLAHLPTVGEGPAPARTSTLGNPLRDTYYWYYATQVMYHMRGEYWAAWDDTLRPLLVESQATTGPLSGSWNPRRPAPDKWASFGGRLYVTAMNLLSLEVTYRHLPLYGERVGSGQ